MRSHIVPRTYLKHFTINDKGDIYKKRVKSRSNYEVVPTNISKECFGHDYYKYVKDDIINQYDLSEDYVEKSLFKWENNWNNVIEKIKIKSPKISKQDVETLVDGIVDLKLRNNYYRKLIDKKRHKEIVDDIILDFQRKTKLLIPKELKEVVKSKFSWNELTPRQIHVSRLLKIDSKESSLINSLKLVLKNSRIFILENYTSKPFVTSDNPVHTIDTQRVTNNFKLEGLEEIIIPITPEHRLSINVNRHDMFSILGKEITYVSIEKIPDKNPVEKVNSVMKFYSHRNIFSHSEDYLKGFR